MKFRALYGTLLLLLLCQLLSAQGFERRVTLPGVNFIQESTHVLLPDNSKFIANESAMMVIDDRANLVWSDTINPEYYILEVDYLGDGDTLVAYALSDISLVGDIFLYTYYYNTAGERIDEQARFIAQEGVNDIFRPALSIITKDSIGNISIFLSKFNDGSGPNAGPEEVNQILFSEIDPDGGFGPQIIIEEGEFLRPLAADRLVDGTFALRLEVDTIFDGSSNLTLSSEAALFHYFPAQDSLLQLSEYSSVIISGGGLSKLDPGIYATGISDNSNRRFWIFDLNGDSLLLESNLPSANFPLLGYSFEGLFRDTSGNLLLYETVNDFGPPQRGIHVTKLSPEGVELSTFITSSLLVEYASQDIYGIDHNGLPYIMGTIPAESLGDPARLVYLYIQLDDSLQSFTNQIEGALWPETADEDCTPDTLANPLQRWWVVAAPDGPGRDTLYAYTDTLGRYTIRCDSGGYDVFTIPPNDYFESCPPILVTLEEANDTVQQQLGGGEYYSTAPYPSLR